MNKKQEKIYNFLLKKPGYLKKSALNLQNTYFKDFKLQDVYDALKQARIDSKGNSPTKQRSALKTQEKGVKSIKLERLTDKEVEKAAWKIVERANTTPKIKRLFWDIETSYNVVSTWNIGYEINVNHDNIIRERAIICICYKWEGEDEVHYLRWKKGDDKQLLLDFTKVLNIADESIGHNSDRFDLKWLRTRCAFHGIPMIPDYKTIDTLKMARGGFRFNSNRLDYLGKFFGFGGKTDTGGFKLWQAIVEKNDEEAMSTMIKYCQDDVILLEKVYNKIEGYSKAKTHIGVLEGKDKCSCPKCGNEKVHKAGTRVSSIGGINQRLYCPKCGTNYSISKITYDKINNEDK